MTTVIGSDSTIRLSPAIRKRAGLRPGDRVEVRARGGVITIEGKPPVADDDEYTPEQRAKLSAELAEAAKGPLHGPFSSGEEIMAYVEKYKQERLGEALKER